MLTYLERDLLDVAQMDCVLAIGMHRARTVAELAHHRNRQFTPHSWTNGVGVLTNPIGIDSEGFIKVSDAPGLGVEINEDAIRRWTVE